VGSTHKVLGINKYCPPAEILAGSSLTALKLVLKQQRKHLH